MLTQDKFEDFKQDYEVLGTVTELDEYRNEQRVTVTKGTIHVMWTPVRDEASIAEYGDRIHDMLQCVLYEGDVELYDRITIRNDLYEVISIKPYQTHFVVQVRRLVNG